MELRDRRHGRDAIATQLRQLLPFRGVDVDEAVHVPDAEALDAVAGMLLPLRSKTARARGEKSAPEGHCWEVESFPVSGTMRDLHRDPSARLVIMPYRRRRLHLLFRRRLSRPPRAHPGKRVDLDRVVITRRGHLARRVERRMADAQAALVLAHQRGQAALALPADLPQVPHSHEAI